MVAEQWPLEAPWEASYYPSNAGQFLALLEYGFQWVFSGLYGPVVDAITKHLRVKLMEVKERWPKPTCKREQKEKVVDIYVTWTRVQV